MRQANFNISFLNQMQCNWLYFHYLKVPHLFHLYISWLDRRNTHTHHYCRKTVPTSFCFGLFRNISTLEISSSCQNVTPKAIKCLLQMHLSPNSNAAHCYLFPQPLYSSHQIKQLLQHPYDVTSMGQSHDNGVDISHLWRVPFVQE